MIKKFFIVFSIFFISNLNSLLGEDIESAKTTCEEIGFEKGTEKFGECVLLLLKKDNNSSTKKLTNVDPVNMRCSTDSGESIGPIIDTNKILATCQQAVTICWSKGEQAYWAAKNGNNSRVNEIVGQMKESDPYTAFPEITRLFGTIMGDNRAQELGYNVLSGCLAGYGYGKL